MTTRVPLRERISARVLGLVPVVVALLFGPLLIPRATPPDVLPLPAPDARELSRTEAADRARAASARVTGLDDDLRVLGTAIRDFHLLEWREAPEIELGAARRKVVDALGPAVRKAGPEGLISLRAVELEAFLVEVERFTATGEESEELGALGGAFVRRMRAEGWCDKHTLLLSGTERRALFKQMWNTFLGLESKKELAISLDETRALFAFFLTHAHPSDAMRVELDSARRGARSERDCEEIAAHERAAVDAWRLERVNRLAQLDPEYPAGFARGVLQFRRGRFGDAADAFRGWLKDHPDGPWATRARFHLRAAMASDQIH